VLDPTNNAVAYAVAPVTSSAFAAEINPAGSGLIYSTYLGSTGLLSGTGIALSSGDVFVTGWGYPPVPPTTETYERIIYNNDAMIVRISAASPACTVSVSPARQIVYGAGATVIYQISAPAGCTWTAASDSPSWTTIRQGASGAGSSVLYLGVSPNTTGASRTANLTIGNQTVSVTQGDSSCVYSLNPPSVAVASAGGNVQIGVTAGAGCPWSVVSGYPTVVSVTSGTAGSGNGTVTLNLAQAAPFTRTVYIDIANTYVAISQSTSCNIAQNATVTATDVRDMINEALGVSKPTDDLNRDGVVSLVDVQIVAGAALGRGCFIQ
jgi:hypothetical protein